MLKIEFLNDIHQMFINLVIRLKDLTKLIKFLEVIFNELIFN